MKCGWCLQDFEGEEPRKAVNTLLLHTDNRNQIRIRSCEEMYRDYTRNIQNTQGFVGPDTWSVGKYER